MKSVFYLFGVVAQLVERSVRIAEVRGSTPLGSTKSHGRRIETPPPSHNRRVKVYLSREWSG